VDASCSFVFCSHTIALTLVRRGQAADFDVTNANAGTTYNGAITSFNAGNNVNVYITENLGLAPGSGSFTPSISGQSLFVAGVVDSGHMPQDRTITGNGSDRIIAIAGFGSAYQSANVDIRNVTLNGGLDGNGFEFFGDNTLLNLNSDATFKSNLFLS
jgi:hypothetical protein